MPEIHLYGEERILEAIKSNPPDYLLLMHHDSKQFGVDFFGRDPRFGRQIMNWVNTNYSGEIRFGAPPMQGPHFGILIMVPKD